MKISSKKYCSSAYFEQLQSLYDWYCSDQQGLEVFTSGTTGKPQAILLSREAIIHSVELSIQFFELNSNTRILLCLPLDKVGGMMLAFRAFHCGAEICPVDPKNNPLEDLPADWHFDFASLVPKQFMAIQQDWHRIKQILLGGGPVSKELLHALKTYTSDTKVFHSYASTETLSHVALRELYPQARVAYTALPGIHFSVNGESCLQIQAPDLGISDLQTKDLVDLHSPTHFTWRGRKDHVVLSGGLKLYPEEIEAALIWPAPFFLSSLPDPDLGEKMVLVMEDSDFKEELIPHLRKQLNGPKRPKAIVLVKELQYTSTQKIKREASLAQPYDLISL